MLSGERVYLRALEYTDLARTHGWINDPEVIDAIGSRAPVSQRQQEQWFEELSRDRSKVVFAICFKETGEHIGNVALRDIDYINRNAAMSIFIGDKRWRRKGIGTEASRLILQYAFFYLNLHKVFLKTTATNHAAITMYERLGFRREGCLKEHEFKNGEYVDKLVLGLTADGLCAEQRELDSEHHKVDCSQHAT